MEPEIIQPIEVIPTPDEGIVEEIVEEVFAEQVDEIPVGVETTTLHLVDGTEIVTILPPPPVYEPCPNCNGQGTILSGTKICTQCNGFCQVEILN